jgi:hypothetical protein
MVVKTQIIATTRRFLSARVTSQSIIEEHSALDDDALAGLEAGGDDGEIVMRAAVGSFRNAPGAI